VRGLYRHPHICIAITDAGRRGGVGGWAASGGRRAEKGPKGRGNEGESKTRRFGMRGSERRKDSP